MSEFKNKLVWSDDPKDKAKINAENDPKVAEVSLDSIKENKWTAVFRLEKASRGGKTVTVIDQLPRNEAWVKALCKELKAKCGVGGTYSLSATHAVIEIQGDKRSELKAIFDKKSYRYKGM